MTDGTGWITQRIGHISKNILQHESKTTILLKPIAQRPFRNIKFKHVPDTFIQAIKSARDWWSTYESRLYFRKQADEEEETQPWKSISLELFSEQHLEILSQRGIDCSASALDHLPSTKSTLRLVGLSEDDCERWIKRLETCLPKRVQLDMKYASATMLADSSKMKELEDGDEKKRLSKFTKQVAVRLLDNAQYDIDRIHDWFSLIMKVLYSNTAFFAYVSVVRVIHSKFIIRSSSSFEAQKRHSHHTNYQQVQQTNAKGTLPCLF